MLGHQWRLDGRITHAKSTTYDAIDLSGRITSGLKIRGSERVVGVQVPPGTI
jgi:hypothetical protein